ncbi:MAG: hypothetical protein JW895_10225 [Thermoleophilaceae bacterium]|nr:hypothetical protein [Thermoleophilaceae bacterium]
MARIGAASLLLAALSLLGPSEPSYDPWAWLVWGREVGQLSLDTAAGPSWKPLPVAFTTLFAQLDRLDHGIAPALWIVVARAGGVFALLVAFRVAARLAGGDRLRRAVAGSVALLALALTPEWIRYLMHGNEAPLAVGLVLLGIDRHLDGHRRSAFLAGAAACLARPELFGFLLLYGAYACLRSRRELVPVAVTVSVVVAAWVLPALWGSGDALSAVHTARSEPSWSLSLRAEPWRAALAVAQDQAWLVLELAALAAAGLAVAALLGRGARPSAAPRPAVVAALSGAAALNVALYVAMTEAGFSGNARYVLPAVAMVAVLGGVGVAQLADLGARAGPAGVAAAAALLLAAGGPEIAAHVGEARSEARDSIERARLHSQLERAVDGLGPGYIALFGPATVNRAFQTHMAWELSVPIEDVWSARGRGLTFVAPPQPVAGPVRIVPKARRRLMITRVGDWTVAERPPGARHVYTWPMVGFSLRRAAQS